MRGLFIVGTDTGVGKTIVTAAIARHLHQQGEAVRVSKPVATGAIRQHEQWVSEDTLTLAQALGVENDSTALQRITPWNFPEPVAPPVAARLAGVTLNIHEMKRAIEQQSRDGFLLVEGVGGLLCPLTEHETVADLAALINLPVIVVARRSLGTLNHTLMTLEVAQRRQLTIAGLIVNETTPPEGLAEETNILELQKRVNAPLLGVLPYQRETPALSPTLASLNWQRLAEN